MGECAQGAPQTLGLAEVVIASGVKVQEGSLLTRSGKALTHTRTGEFETLFGEPTNRHSSRQVAPDFAERASGGMDSIGGNLRGIPAG